MTDKPTDQQFQDALDCAWMLTEKFDSYVVQHPMIAQTPELAAAAAKAYDALHDFYQQLGTHGLTA